MLLANYDGDSLGVKTVLLLSNYKNVSMIGLLSCYIRYWDGLNFFQNHL